MGFLLILLVHIILLIPNYFIEFLKYLNFFNLFNDSLNFLDYSVMIDASQIVFLEFAKYVYYFFYHHPLELFFKFLIDLILIYFYVY